MLTTLLTLIQIAEKWASRTVVYQQHRSKHSLMTKSLRVPQSRSSYIRPLFCRYWRKFFSAIIAPSLRESFRLLVDISNMSCLRWCVYVAVSATGVYSIFSLLKGLYLVCCLHLSRHLIIVTHWWTALLDDLCTGWPNKNCTFLRYHIFAATTDIIMRFLLQCSEITAKKRTSDNFLNEC